MCRVTSYVCETLQHKELAHESHDKGNEICSVIVGTLIKLHYTLATVAYLGFKFGKGGEAQGVVIF